MIDGGVKCFEPEKLSMFIEEGWNILGSIFYGLHNLPLELYKRVNPKDVGGWRGLGEAWLKPVLPVIGMARAIAVIKNTAAPRAHSNISTA